jgi:hypothetical protein
MVRLRRPVNWRRFFDKLWPVSMRRLLPILLLAISPAHAAKPPLELDVDRPVQATIAGKPVTLALSSGTVDHVLLNYPVVQRLRLRPVGVDNLADLTVGGIRVLRGRHGPAWVRVAGRWQEEQIYWFPDASPLPLDGSIGPMAFPHPRLNLRFARGNAPTAVRLRLAGEIDTTAYGVVASDGLGFVITVDPGIKRSLPVVSAAVGGDLAEVLGGQLVGESWLEEIVFGVRRPVRRLVLDRPLMLGRLRFDEVAVRVGGPPDRTQFLAPGQKPIGEAPEDPAEIIVRGRTLVQRRVAYVMTLSRTQLEQHGCSHLAIDKHSRRWELACQGSAAAPIPAQPAAPLAPPPAARSAPGRANS